MDAESAARKQLSEQAEFEEQLKRDMKDLNGKLRTKEKILEEMSAASGAETLELRGTVQRLEGEVR